MHNQIGKVFRIGYCIFLIALVIGIYFYVTGQTNFYYQSLIVGTFASIVIISSAIIEIFSSEKITIVSKILWVLFFISFNIIAVAIYIVVTRPKVITDYART